jgi:anhydro-N-acetylmuramic acid kinase
VGISAGQVAAIGSHGQTLRHRTDLPVPFTWQIGDPSTLAEMTGITVVGDFRRRDVAAGGQGAPLLPVFHDQVFRSDSEDRVIANLGGIANVTILARGKDVTGFDTGPANRLLDAWIGLHEGKEYDANGAWAAGGTIDQTLLQELLDEPYLRLAPPKSTGRELFNLPWLKTKLGLFPRHAQDVQATLQQYTACTLAAALRQYAPGAALFVCGGGAHNSALLKVIANLIATNRVASTESLGLDPDYVEAVAFAWFAKRTLAGMTSSAGSVTGAKGARILGGVYRYA